jgi:hypothetical protein
MGSLIKRPDRPNTTNANSRPPPSKQPPKKATGGARGGTAQPAGAERKFRGVLVGAAAMARGTSASSARPLTHQRVGGQTKPGSATGGLQVGRQA